MPRGRGVRINLLGPVELLAHGVPVQLQPKPRALVAALALAPGKVVPHERLVSAVWGGRPPASVATKMHSYISLLRKAIGQRDVTTGPLFTHGRGYQLAAAVHELDLLEFDTLVRQARRQVEKGALVSASASFTHALRIWNGPVCVNVESPAIRAAAEPLEQRRLMVVEDRAEVDLELGRYGWVIDELSGQIVVHPLRERTRALLMLALYRRGCRAEAMAVYRAGRQLIADELGLEPGPELRRLHEAMLVGSATLLSGPISDARQNPHTDDAA
jgi:DNA-binding SARP family transcriptional activator